MSRAHGTLRMFDANEDGRVSVDEYLTFFNFLSQVGWGGVGGGGGRRGGRDPRGGGGRGGCVSIDEYLSLFSPIISPLPRTWTTPSPTTCCFALPQLNSEHTQNYEDTV